MRSQLAAQIVIHPTIAVLLAFFGSLLREDNYAKEISFSVMHHRTRAAKPDLRYIC